MSRRHVAAIAVLGGALVLGGCELGPKAITQTGYRGTAMAQIVDLKSVKEQAAIPADPYPLPPATGPRAGEVYQNLQVLGNVPAEQFNHLMAQITQWVSPEQGCNYCHNPANLADDSLYTKRVARQMLRMTREINSTWRTHVKDTGVTCYTCHRGNVVPQYSWAVQEGTPNPRSILRNKRGQNTPEADVGYASLPYDPFALYLSGNYSSRVAGKSLYPPTSGSKTVKEAEASYGFMMHLSKSLGVNCTFCHNTQSLGAWNLSRPQRATAYYGIRMVSGINEAHIEPLAAIFPVNRKGPKGDPYKVNCMTCHQGLNKPLGGKSMIATSPLLRGPAVAAAEDVGGVAARAATEAQFDAPAQTNTGPAAAPADRPVAPAPVPAQ